MSEQQEYREPVSFEEAMRRLDELLRKLDDGNLALEELLKAYEEGNRLVAYCRSRLEKFEQRIEILNRSGEGDGQWQPFEPGRADRFERPTTE